MRNAHRVTMIRLLTPNHTANTFPRDAVEALLDAIDDGNPATVDRCIVDLVGAQDPRIAELEGVLAESNGEISCLEDELADAHNDTEDLRNVLLRLHALAQDEPDSVDAAKVLAMLHEEV